MLQINYQLHLILNSKYRIFYNFAIILFIYLILYGNKIILCSNEGQGIPPVAENKRSFSVNPEEQNKAYKLLYEQEKKQVIAEQSRTEQAESKYAALEQDFEQYKNSSIERLSRSLDNLLHVTRHIPFFNEIDIGRVREDIHEFRAFVESTRVETALNLQRAAANENTIDFLRDQLRTKERLIEELRTQNIALQNTVTPRTRSLPTLTHPLNPTESELKEMKDCLFGAKDEKK